jgi:hypothetical protein
MRVWGPKVYKEIDSFKTKNRPEFAFQRAFPETEFSMLDGEDDENADPIFHGDEDFEHDMRRGPFPPEKRATKSLMKLK